VLPIHNLGYREWSGELESSATRWTVIAEIGIRRAWQSSWLRRMIFFAWVPAVGLGFMIFLFERAAENGGEAAEAFSDLSRILVAGADRNAGRQFVQDVLTRRASGNVASLAEQRHVFWTALFMVLFRRSQVFLLIPMVGLIAPPLISQDVRSRGFLLYFSRPLTQLQYIVGKAAVVMVYLLLITLLPALLLYVFGVLLSPDLSIVQYTWDLPLRIVAASTLIVIPCTCLSLMFSSITTESRYAAFAWFAVWIFGAVTYVAVRPIVGPGGNAVMESLSLMHLFSDVSYWMLDPDAAVSDIGTRFVVLAVITVVSLAILKRKVAAPMQV
jgi:ABC-2 type transport system permease protein